MLLGSNCESCIFGNACCGIDLLDGLKSALDSVDGEDRVEISGNDSKLSRCDKASQILHLEIATRRGDVVSSAVKHSHNRIIVRAECTAWNTDFYALVDAGGIIRCRTAARVARNKNFVKIALLKI